MIFRCFLREFEQLFRAQLPVARELEQADVIFSATNRILLKWQMKKHFSGEVNWGSVNFTISTISQD